MLTCPSQDRIVDGDHRVVCACAIMPKDILFSAPTTTTPAPATTASSTNTTDSPEQDRLKDRTCARVIRKFIG